MTIRTRPHHQHHAGKYRISRTQISKGHRPWQKNCSRHSNYQPDWDFCMPGWSRTRFSLSGIANQRWSQNNGTTPRKCCIRWWLVKPASVEDPRRMGKNVFYPDQQYGAKGGYSPKYRPPPFPGRAEGSWWIRCTRPIDDAPNWRNNELITDYPWKIDKQTTHLLPGWP